MRGRLIDPFGAELAQLDTAATAADPDGPGPLPTGYDADFQEPVRVAAGAGPGDGHDSRREKPTIVVPCQVEVQSFGALTELANGSSPHSHLTLVFHFQDLERLGLIDPVTGDALLRVGDRLVALRELRTNELVQAIRTPPGLYVIEAQPQAFGLGRRRNLLFVTFEERALGARAGVS